MPRHRPFRRLSRGQKAQVALSLALATDSELLILDDPTLGLDAVARRSILEELVDELAGGGRTILITTHDLAGIEGLADRVAFLKEGRLILDEPLERLKERFRLLRWQEGEGPAGELTVVQRREGPWGQEAVVSDFTEGWGQEGCEVSALSLEEIFVALGGGEQEVPS
ncbi:MAG: AAA family ATPase [Deltaproteobacteria bacterium]|nr:AAA family ATPase [Deltaproteobacteria bacterium]